MASPYARYYTYIKPITENPVIRSYAPYIFSIVTIMILLVFAIRPTVSTILNLQREIDNKKKTLETLNAKAQALTQAKANYDNLGKATIDKINLAVPLQAEVPFLVKSLQSASQTLQSSSSALQLQPVSLTPTALQKPHPDLGKVEFAINISASYLEISNVLQRLSKSPRILSLDSITITKPAEGSTVLSVRGKAYYLK